MNSVFRTYSDLASVLRDMGPVAIAVSGGVDSLTLATFAHRLSPASCTMFHAISAAVPPDATQRTETLSIAEGWQLQQISAGEFNDERYVKNPVNRCFYCKTNLYARIHCETSSQIVSGTNLDDLSDYRPGLQAADNHKVRHPFVETGMTKAMVRRLSRDLKLGRIAELPASPCLSSRVETGKAVDAAELRLVHSVETRVSAQLQPQAVRCRLRHKGIVIELDEKTLASLSRSDRNGIVRQIRSYLPKAVSAPDVSFAEYKMGSAFVHKPERLSPSEERSQ